MATTLSLGFSPCPNDTFIFHALVQGLIETGGLVFEPRLEDVETLNRLALAGALDVTKVSYGALPHLLDEYTLLRSGGAVGRGCGPLIVAKRPFSPDRLPEVRIAIPGHLTTANLLLRLYSPGAPPGIEMEYHRIMQAVASGVVEAGLIIHESRFTFRDHGLVQIVDLGEWWEATTGAPIPLGAIVARRALGDTATMIEGLIRDSVVAAFHDPGRSRSYVQSHAQELPSEIARRHIELYVNEFTLDLGAEGEAAVHELIDRAKKIGILVGADDAELRTAPPSTSPLHLRDPAQ